MNVLTITRIEAILNYADKIRIVSNIYDRPMDAEKFVQVFSGSVIKTQKTDNITSEPRIIPGDGVKFSIEYSPHKDDRSNRFTVMHMMGHLLLHTNYVADNFILKEEYVDKYWNDNDADLFASAVLMPREQFFYIASKNIVNSKYNIPAIASCFGVLDKRARDYGRRLSSYRWNEE